ncbi:telomerase reverse transcriptase isoform X2 [Solenopsis invicta]|uniref:telomerase reverse transcriptase isoform X2 n=1 Tax=Solenopsis invicta TaxID=13686 RepID=UPI0005959F9C|nr:telomerase reverse transcriptase isoform X2 [Solenopsis invicta]
MQQHTILKIKVKANMTSFIPSTRYNCKVRLFESRSRIRQTSRTTAKISKYHILESRNTVQDICRKILDRDIGLVKPYRSINLDHVIPALSPILKSFKDRHNRFNYFDKLKHTIENTRCKKTQENKKPKYKHQIDVCLVQAFFSLLLYKIVPLELFGTSRNRKLIKSTIYRLLKTKPNKIPVSQPFKRKKSKRTDAIGGILDLEHAKPFLLKKLDISQIQWLHSINNDTVRRIIILKLLHWFFAQYIIKILHKYVVLNHLKKQWVYITKDNWCNMQEEFIKEKKDTNNLVPYAKLNNTYIGIYKFLPSSSGLRALFITKNSKGIHDSDYVVLRFLQQLYVTYFDENGPPTIKGCKNMIKHFTSRFKNQQLYYVRCDIQDAFGAIIQKKLFDIIDTHCKKLYEKHESYLKSSIFKENVTRNSTDPKLKVSIKRLKNRIYKLIHLRKVKFNGQVYSIKELGVPQGASLSPILCDIYYQNMIKEIFSEYLDNGLLYRYVDDMLYMTSNETYATRFLKIVESGIPEYNVKFNQTKTDSNVDTKQQHKNKNFTFLNKIRVTV